MHLPTGPEEEEGGAAARRPPRRSLGDGDREGVGPRAAGGARRVHDVPTLPGTNQGGHRHNLVPPHILSGVHYGENK